MIPCYLSFDLIYWKAKFSEVLEWSELGRIPAVVPTTSRRRKKREEKKRPWAKTQSKVFGQIFSPTGLNL